MENYGYIIKSGILMIILILQFISSYFSFMKYRNDSEKEKFTKMYKRIIIIDIICFVVLFIMVISELWKINRS